jgi:hypothetical protein
MKAFSPAEAKGNKINVVPKELLQAVNELLSERYVDYGEIHIKLKDVKARCKKILGVDEMFSGINPMDSWPEGVWDFEPIYRQAGWKVSYDNPGYNESYDGFYIFNQKKD